MWVCMCNSIYTHDIKTIKSDKKNLALEIMKIGLDIACKIYSFVLFPRFKKLQPCLHLQCIHLHLFPHIHYYVSPVCDTELLLLHTSKVNV